MESFDIDPSSPILVKAAFLLVNALASFMVKIPTHKILREFPKSRFGRSRRVQDGQCGPSRLPITGFLAGREAAPHFSSFSIAGFACRRSLIKTMA
jgi:hypothetical protein